jgi:hypothetical protein
MITPSFGLAATERVLPKLALDFTTASLDPRIIFTRADNTATRVNSSGYVEIIGADTPRFDYDPVTLICKGLLIEESRTNILTYSNTFSNAIWLKGTSNTTADPVVTSGYASPDGTLNAFRVQITLPGDTQWSLLRQRPVAVSVSSGGSLAQSVYLKASDPSQIGKKVTVYVYDITNLTYKALVNHVLTDSWVRVSTISTFGGGTSSIEYSIGKARSTNGGPTDAEAATDFLLYGAQLEVGAFATSYIPTTTTALTRNADVATMTGINFSDFWQATRGGVLVRALPSTVSGTRPLIQFDDNTADNIIALRGNITNPELYIVDGGTPQAQLDAGTIVANTPYSLTGWWQENNSFAQLNTQASVRDNTVTIPTVTQARIGSDGTNYLNGTIAAIYYYDELANSIYDSLRLLGYTGTVTDMLLQYYLARGATSNSLTDAEIEFLGVKGFTTGTIDDRWTNYLISLGYFGTITDMKYQYWKSPE